ncbi:hypothetical protein DZD52_10950 [Xanthomonas nasturtii]|uniref:Uncharacterized protein n=1 Tax=Xanthomonas nasturtii TaxID=1843581 RepID=A0A3E1KL80_9XANT|nr:hypothetical protein DZD52_10950 [Xanthomonas nasturtii]
MSRALDSLLCLEFALPRLAPAVFAAALCACAVPAMASTSLNSRADVIAALDAGYDVSLTTDLSRCTPEQGTPASQTRGGGHIDAYRITEDGTVAFSGSHFTVASNDKVRKQSRLRTYPHPPLRGTFSRREKGRLFAVQGSARGRSPSPAGDG